MQASRSTMSGINREELVVPRVEERIVATKRRTVGDRVRIEKKVESREVEVEGEATEVRVEVERVPVNRYVSRPPPPRIEGDVTIIPVLEEVAVVEKRLLLKEEIRVTKHRRVVRRKLRVPLRRERVAVERTPPTNSDERERTGGHDENGDWSAERRT